MARRLTPPRPRLVQTLEVQPQAHLDLTDVEGEVAVVGAGDRSIGRAGIGRELVDEVGRVLGDLIGRGADPGDVLVVGEVECLGEEFEAIYRSFTTIFLETRKSRTQALGYWNALRSMFGSRFAPPDPLKDEVVMMDCCTSDPVGYILAFEDPELMPGE